MLREPHNRIALLVLWGVLICCVVIGSLAPAASPLMIAIGRFHIWDKLQHFGAYLALSFLPVIGFRDKRRGIVAGLSMFVLGTLLEGGQHFSPGRAVEFGDVIANSAGVSCGALLLESGAFWPPERRPNAVLTGSGCML